MTALVRVAAVQLALDLDDPDGTARRLGEALKVAAGAGANLVVLPELATTGAAFGDSTEARGRADSVDGPSLTRLARLGAELGLVLVVGFCETSGHDRPYDSVAVLDHGNLVGVHRKTHLWGREKMLFTPGAMPPAVVTTSIGRIGTPICYELEFPEVTRRLAREGAQLLLAPANWPLLPKPAGAWPIEIAKAQTAAAANRVFVVVADCCGQERNQAWTGGSVICGTDGYLLAGPRLGEPTMLLTDLDPADAENKQLGEHNDAFDDLRPDLY